MASKYRGTSRTGSTAGQSKLLQLLRRHGYSEELPPSTVSWLDTRPVFRWLAEHLSDDNFVPADAQRIFEAIQLQAECTGSGGSGAKAAAQLMSAMGISDGSSSSDGEDPDGLGTRHGEGDAGWAATQSCEELQRAIEEQQSHKELLQQQLSSIGAVTRRLAAATATHQRGAAQQRRSVLGSLRASQLRAAHNAAAEAGREVDCELLGLAEELERWAQLAEGPGSGECDDWLLCTADAGGYAARDANMQELVSRGMQLVSAAAGVMPPAGSDATDSSSDVQDTPSKAVRSGGGDTQRWRDQERRNEGLREELTRQRMAFKVAYDERIAALAKRAGAEGALAAVEALIEAERHRQGLHTMQVQGTGGAVRAPVASAAAAGEGVVAILQQAPQLRREAESLEHERLMLEEVQLPALHVALARLNDTHVLEGDYDRQLCKMRVAHERKRALIETLLDAAARHAVLREVQAGELRWLQELQGAVEEVRALVEAVVAAAAWREGSYAAVAAGVAAQRQRSSVAPEDGYLQQLQQLLQPGMADWAAVHAGTEEQQQQQWQARGGSAVPSTPPASAVALAPMLTPRTGRGPPKGFATIKHICSGLSALADTLRLGESALQNGLFADMPGRLGDMLSAERQLRGLAFPVAAAGAAAGEAQAGGAAQALVPVPVLTSPALSEAMRALEGLNHQIGGAINRLLQQQQDWATVQKQQAREQQLERRVMSWMFTDPGKLGAAVRELRTRVQAMEASGQAAVAAGPGGVGQGPA